MLKFSFRNSKIRKLAKMLNLKNKEVACFDLPAGYSCPAADMCLSYANRKTGKITDGKNCKFRCYAASNESAFTNARNLRWHNFDALRMAGEGMVQLLLDSLPSDIRVLRIHSSGDFFSREYFNAWVNVAKNRPEITFFGYTKVLEYVDADKPDNFRLVYSFGGKHDKELSGQPTAYVQGSTPKADPLPLSCVVDPADDFNFVMAQVSFALPLHGTQPAKKKVELPKCE